MKIAEYAGFDALGLAGLIASGQVTAKEVAICAAEAIAAANPAVNAVVESYPDRVEDLDEKTLGSGPFRGVPFLFKDIYGHEAGRRVEFGSRLCRGMVAQQDTHLCRLLRAAGVNIIGRSAAPEFSLTGTTEGALYGNTSTPWRQGYAAGGSTGGGMAAVVAGMVPIAHGSDIAGSIRIPASHCGGVGLKPSRGRIPAGPLQDEGGFGLMQNFVQAKSVRDAATMLDCLAIPQPGDPFVIPKPAESYAALIQRQPARLRIGWSTAPLMGVETDAEVAAAVAKVAHLLGEMGHEVVEESPAFDGLATLAAMLKIWLFGWSLRLDGYAKSCGRTIGPDTLEPVTLTTYEFSRQLLPSDFVTAQAELNSARRRLGEYFTRHDIWLTPTTPKVAEPWGHYNLSRTGLTAADIPTEIYAPISQYTLPHNVMGTPAISLPLAMHSSGLPIGIQLGARPAEEDILLQLAATLEEALPWSQRIPPLHASLVTRK